MPLHPFLEKLRKSLEGRPSFSDGSPREARVLVANGRAGLGSGPEMYDVKDVAIPSRGGNLTARLFKPAAACDGLAAYIHGGGWVVGSIDDFDAFGRTLAKESGFAVLMPAYRLAPEHPFPAALHDCEDTLLWMKENQKLLGCAGPLIIAGDSAGANLATVVVRLLRGKVKFALQVLIYPVTNCDFGTSSYHANREGFLLTAADMEWFFGHYAPREKWPHTEISPVRSEDLGGLPDTLIVTAEFDVLKDEGRAYADKLKAAGVGVEYREVAGMTHGFIRMHNLIDVAKNEMTAIAQRIATTADTTRRG